MDDKLALMPWKTLIECVELELQSRGPKPIPVSATWRAVERWLQHQVSRILSRRTDITAADRDDIVQSILLQLQDSSWVRKLIEFNSVEGYLTQVIRNRATDITRKRKIRQNARRRLEPIDLFIEDDATDLDNEQLFAALRELLSDLSEADEELLRMRFWAGMTIGEIASRLGIRYSAAAVRIFRILRRLKQKLELDD